MKYQVGDETGAGGRGRPCEAGLRGGCAESEAGKYTMVSVGGEIPRVFHAVLWLWCGESVEEGTAFKEASIRASSMFLACGWINRSLFLKSWKMSRVFSVWLVRVWGGGIGPGLWMTKGVYFRRVNLTCL